MEPNLWNTLHLPPARLVEARLQCHHAVQINTRFARGFVTPQADDSHTSLAWDAASGALMGQAFAHQGRELRAGLRLRDLTLLFDGAECPLDGITFQDAIEWLSERLRRQTLDPSPLSQPIHFELNDHPLLHGAKFSAKEHAAELQELARYYSNAAATIEAIATPVRCWPHHFDIAALITKGEHTLGVGMSPGDGSYSQPYFYVSPFPAPDVDDLPRLNSKGHWHTEGWTGVVLTASQFHGDKNQQTIVRTFIEDAVAACAALL